VNDAGKSGISLRHGIAIYISSVLGGGILILPGIAADASGPSSILAWIVLSFASFPFAYTFSRLAMRAQGSGGIYSFSLEAFGRGIGNGVGWLFLAWVVIGAPAVAIAAATYLSFSIPLTRVEIFLVAFLLIASVTFINYRGIRFSANLQLSIIIVLISLLGISIIAAIPRISLNFFHPFFIGNGFVSVGTAMALVIWAYFGYENVPNLAGEFSDLQKDMRRSVLYSVVIISLLYASVSIVTVGTDAYKSGNGLVPFAAILSGLFGVYGGFVAGIIAMVAIFSTMNAYFAGLSRVIHAVSSNGGFPPILSSEAKQKNKFGRATLLLGVLGTLSLSLFWISNVTIETAFLIVSGIGVTTYIIGSAAGIKMLDLRGWRRYIPWASLAISAVIVIFIGKLMVFSIGVFLVSLVYTMFKDRKKYLAYLP
jgi:amino acid efflux transporter